MKKNKNFNRHIPAENVFILDFKPGEEYTWAGWGLVIRHLRQSCNMDQTVFGRFIGGYTRAQISRYEKETSEPPIDFWIKMMKIFGLNISWALTGKGLPYIEEYQDSGERNTFLKWCSFIVESDLEPIRKKYLAEYLKWSGIVLNLNQKSMRESLTEDEASTLKESERKARILHTILYIVNDINTFKKHQFQTLLDNLKRIQEQPDERPTEAP